MPIANAPRIAVIGAGLSGLAAAFRAQQAGAQVTVFEAEARVGGSICTEREAGFLVELGAEAFAAHSLAVLRLTQDLDLSAELVEQSLSRCYGFDGTSLQALDAGEGPARLGLSGRSANGAGVRSFRHGMSQLIERLHQRLTQDLREPEVVRTNCGIQRLERDGAGFVLHTAEESAAFDAVVMAAGSKLGARLLGPHFGALARGLESARSVASLTVSLAYRRGAIRHPLDGTGFVTANEAQAANCVACTFTSSKFAGRAPADYALLRAFFRPSIEELALPLSVFRERAVACLGRALSISEPPTASWESRWAEAFPVLDEAERARVTALETELSAVPLALTGSAFHGSGIDAAVRSADQAAQKLNLSRESP